MHYTQIYFRKVKFLLGKDLKKLIPICFAFILATLLDLIGLGIIAGYIALIIDISMFRDFIKDYPFLRIVGALSDGELILNVGIALVLIFTFKFISTIGINYLIFRFASLQQSKLQKDMMRYLLRQSYEDFISRNSAEYLSAITNATRGYKAVLKAVLTLVSTVTVLIGVLFALVIVNYQIVLGLLGMFVPVFFIFNKYFQSRLFSYGQNFNEGITSMLKDSSEASRGFKEINILGKGSFFEKSFDKGVNKVFNAQIRLDLVSITPRNLIEVVLIIFLVSVMAINTFLERDMAETIITLGVFAAASIRIAPMFSLLQTSFNEIFTSEAAITMLYRFLSQEKDFKSVVNPTSNKLEGSMTPDERAFKIFRMENISYSYPSSKIKTIDSLSLEINAGDYVGFVGLSGAGKTTLIDIFLGLLRPNEGKVLFDNRDMYSNLQDWRSKIAYLPQEIFLIDSSIQQNILLGDELNQDSARRLEDSISKSMLKDFVDTLPDRLETQLGDRGVRLSGGQRQRVSIARSFFHEREILVLDESTSSLDSDTEVEIIDQLLKNKGNKTIISIAHRISTLKNCNKIYVLRNGRVDSPITYEELLQRQTNKEINIEG